MTRPEPETYIAFSQWEKSLIREYLQDGMEQCDHDIAHCKQQKQVKKEKGQMARAKEYQHQIDQSIKLKGVLATLVEKLK